VVVRQHGRSTKKDGGTDEILSFAKG
jgi:hypothetical protein